MKPIALLGMLPTSGQSVLMLFPCPHVPFHVQIQVRALAKRNKAYHHYGPALGGNLNRQMKTPPPNSWITNPMLGSSPSPQEELDGSISKNRVRLYLSEGPVRILSAHVNILT